MSSQGVSLENCIEGLLRCGLNDLITAWDLEGVVARYGGARTPEEVRAMALDLVRNVLEGGLAEIGEFNHEFRSWALPPAEAVRRLDSIWRKTADSGDLMGEFWLRNTKQGAARGRTFTFDAGKIRALQYDGRIGILFDEPPCELWLSGEFGIEGETLAAVKTKTPPFPPELFDLVGRIVRSFEVDEQGGSRLVLEGGVVIRIPHSPRQDSYEFRGEGFRWAGVLERNPRAGAPP